MAENTQDEAWQLFERALDLSDSEREKLLSDMRQTRPMLAGEVESLLKHEAAAGENSFWRRGLAEQRPEELPGEIGPYRVVREIGRGGMGVVYEAVHVDMGLDKHVALKVLPAQRSDPESRERFYREARLAASLHHTHIVPVLNAGIHDGRPWYAMTFVRGGSLSSVVRSLRQTSASTRESASVDTPTDTYESTGGCPRPDSLPERPHADPGHPLADPAGEGVSRPHAGALPERVEVPFQDVTSSQYFRWVAELGIQAAKALDYAHHAEGRGLIHRDIKPANLLLDEDGALWITDFGLAKRLTDPTLTADHHVLGTPCYMSPEQAAGGPLDRRSDVYSLGATLYELITLQAVFTGTLQQVLKQIERQEPDRPRRHNCAVPRDLEAIVLKALAKRPAERYQTAADLADDLERWLSSRPIRARRTSAVGHALRWCRRQPLAVALILSLVVGSCTSIYFGLSADHRAREADDARKLADRRAVEAADEARRADTEAAEAGRQAKRADDKAAEAVAHARESHRRLVAHHVSSGVQLLDAGDALAAAPWFVEALRLDSDDPERARLHRLRVAGVLEASPRLLHAWFHTGRVRGLCLSGDEGRVVTAGEGGLVQVHDLVTGELLNNKSLGNPIASFSASGGGQRVAVCTSAGTTHVWDMAVDADLGRFLSGWRNDVTRVLLSDDGLRLATLHGQREVRVWDVERGVQRAGPLQHPNDVLCWSFSPDGRRLITGTGGRETPAQFNQAQIWDTETGSAIAPVMTHSDDVLTVSWSPDGRRVATGGWDNVAQVWDAVTGQAVLPRPVRHDAPVTHALITQHGHFLITGSEDQTVRVWNIPQGTPIGPKLQHGGPVLDLQLAPDESCIASGGFDRSVRFWNAHDGSSPLARLPHLSAVERVALTRNGYAITACADGSVRIWDIRTNTEPVLSLLTGGCAEQITLSPDETRYLTVTGSQNNVANHFARIWNAQTGAPLGPPLRHGSHVEWAEFSPNGEMIVTACRDGTARLWNAADGAAIGEPLVHQGRLFRASFHPDGKSVLIASADGTARLWDVATCQERRRVTHASAVNRALLSRSGELFATASADHTARIWNTATGEPCTEELRHAGSVIELAFSPDGRRLGTASDDKTARVWEVKTGRPLTPPLNHADVIRTIAFSPHGRRLATGSDDWTARVWNATSGEPLTPYLHHDDKVNRVAFSNDGTMLATASGGPIRANVGEARVWDAATGEPLTPWLRHGNDVFDCRFDAAGKYLYTASWDWRVRKWELPFDKRPPEDLQLVAEISAGYRIDKMTGVASVEPAEFRSRWMQRGNVRTHIARSPTALARWHEPRATAALQRLDWAPAAYHLGRLAELRPHDASLLWQLAPIQWYLDDREGYRATRTKLLALYHNDSSIPLGQVATVCFVAPQNDNGLVEVSDAARNALDKAPELCGWHHSYAALAYRLDKFDDCQQSLDKAREIHKGHAPLQDVLFHVMLLCRRGEASAARPLFERCRRTIESERIAVPERPTPNAWNHVVSEILFREAQQLVDAATVPIPNNVDKASSAD
ncbi:MAG TPA: protein kinase [Pirellulales bacterium]|nr:protein kinase [Pirellulales bacterium]